MSYEALDMAIEYFHCLDLKNYDKAYQEALKSFTDEEKRIAIKIAYEALNEKKFRYQQYEHGLSEHWVQNMPYEP